MSRYDELSKRLDELSNKFESDIDKTMDDVTLDGVRLKDALKSQVTLQLIFETAVSKVKYVRDQIEFEMESAYSNSINVELKNSYRDTSISEAKEFAKCDEIYKKFRRLFLDANALLDDCKSALETVQTRKYVLHNLTNVVVSANENHIL